MSLQKWALPICERFTHRATIWRSAVPRLSRNRVECHPTTGELHNVPLDSLFLLCSHASMSDRPASWRMPTTKQMEKMAAEAAFDKNWPTARPTGPAAPMPAEHWDAVPKDAGADVRQTGRPIQSRRLSEIDRHVLRVSCDRCGRIFEIQRVDASRLYGPDAVWKEVGQRLLDGTCLQRTGRHEEDGCWPAFE